MHFVIFSEFTPRKLTDWVLEIKADRQKEMINLLIKINDIFDFFFFIYFLVRVA
jgi:hypothetical protein